MVGDESKHNGLKSLKRVSFVNKSMEEYIMRNKNPSYKLGWADTCRT